MSCPLGGCRAPTALATQQEEVLWLALDPESVYWGVETSHPYGYLMRVAKPAAIGFGFSMLDVGISAGDRGTLWIVSANRDAHVFGAPDAFDIGRTPNPHVSLGAGGPHHCLGAHLARLEARVVFEELRPLLSRLTMSAPPVRGASTPSRYCRSRSRAAARRASSKRSGRHRPDSRGASRPTGLSPVCRRNAR